MKTVLIAGLGLAPLAFGAAHASDPDEFTLAPVVGSSQIIYTPQTTTTTGSTIVTQPAGNGQFQDVDINDYLIQDTTNSQ